MKVKFIILLSLLILMMGAAAAADNATCDNLTSQIQTDDINVTFDEQMWKENLTDISVELPENSSGDFCVKIDDEVIYNRTITEKSFRVPIKLPERDREIYIAIYPPIDCKQYKVSAFYNGIDLNINSTLKVMNYPPDFNYFHFPEEILQGDYYPPMIIFPRSSNGIVELYIDGNLINRTKARPTIVLNKQNLELGNHTLNIVYYNDTYYDDINETFGFNVTQAVISIPKKVIIGHDDCISVRTKNNVQGTVNVYIDSKLVKSGKLNDGDYVLSLENYLTVNSREVTVTVKTKNFERSRTQLLNVSYDFDIYSYMLIYGEENFIEITLPDTLNNKLLNITVNGTAYSFTHPSNIMNNVFEVDVSKLGVGNYSMFISYAGDGRFMAQNKTYNFTIEYRIMCPYDIVFKDASKLYLNLPGNANGSVVVYVDGKLFKTSKLTGGHAEIRIDSLAPGRHDINVSYDGDDYPVRPYVSVIWAEPKITPTYRFTAGEDKYISVEVPKSSGGYAIFDIGGRMYNVSIRDGIAKLSLKNLKPGEYDIYTDYYGDDGVGSQYNWNVITVYKPKIKILSGELTFKSVYLKIKLLNKQGKAMAGKKVTIKVAGKTFRIKTDKKGVAVLKKSLKLKNKKYKIRISYMGVKKTKTLKVKPIYLKASTTSKKLVLKATLSRAVRGETVTFKFNGKKYAAKTDKKGVAKVTIKKSMYKKLKAGKTVKCQASYLKETVKKSVRVK